MSLDPKQVFIEGYQAKDCANLHSYLNLLSDESKKRFAPHPVDKDSITDIFKNSSYSGFVAKDFITSKIIGYSIIRTNIFDYEFKRFQEYGITLNDKYDCSYAPSVADEWQGKGIGTALFRFILKDLMLKNVQKRIILWGGVQKDNNIAIGFYKRNGFRVLGEFEYQGKNYDMIFEFNKDNSFSAF